MIKIVSLISALLSASHTAQAHYDAGHYHWMAQRLSRFEPRRILDIGCGTGQGLRVLFETLGPDLEVVAADENGACLDACRAALSEAGISSAVIKRLHTAPGPAGFVHEGATIELPRGSQCTLVEADICEDPLFVAALLAEEKLDAVTIWLTGTHMMRMFHATVLRRGISDDGKHRLSVQNAVYELADKVLVAGGVLQVVDRTEAPMTDKLRQDFLNAHRDQASVTSLEVCELEYRIYEEPGNRQTPMKLTVGSSGRVPEKFQTAMTSIISVKR